MADDVLTVADLVATASLDTRLLAGTTGAGREVLWAHSCEMPDPAQWLGPHELLMTVGLCVPSSGPDQVRFIARLDESGLAGLMIGDHDPAPKLTGQMLAEADRRGFPVLLAGPQTPYAVVARHVAAANTSGQTLQVLKLSKLYHVASTAGDDVQLLIGDLTALLSVGIEIEDAETGLQLFSAAHRSATAAARTQRRYALRGHHRAQLLITEYPGEELDSFLLVHLMKVLELAVDRVLNAADRRSEVSARLMLALLNGTALPETMEFLAPHRAAEGFHLVAFPADAGPTVARAVSALQLPVVVGAGRVHHLALVPVAEVDRLRQLLDGVIAHAGASSVFTDFIDTRIAAVEAGKVLGAAQHAGQFWTSFEGSAVSVLTRSHREAAEIVTGVLGSLSDDSARAVMLRETLFAYLRNDRRWKETAGELNIHRQTLSYRLGKIEEETGMNLSRSSDLSAVWIAYQAWEVTRAGAHRA